LIHGILHPASTQRIPWLRVSIAPFDSGRLDDQSTNNCIAFVLIPTANCHKLQLVSTLHLENYPSSAANDTTPVRRSKSRPSDAGIVHPPDGGSISLGAGETSLKTWRSCRRCGGRRTSRIDIIKDRGQSTTAHHRLRPASPRPARSPPRHIAHSTSKGHPTAPLSRARPALVSNIVSAVPPLQVWAWIPSSSSPAKSYTMSRWS
jgi:hypothetical protein